MAGGGKFTCGLFVEVMWDLCGTGGVVCVVALDKQV